MNQVALYRKYRSQTFADLVGQEHVVKTLQSGIERGRIAHAYLFTGPRGTGKTSTARLLAKAINCKAFEHPSPEPCNSCEACVSISAGNAMDVHELDAASESGVDKVRQIIVEAVDYAPAFCRFRVFIIDEVHDLSRQAFDALLKTIEEPPSHVVFILATTEYSKVPPTIRSRCQRYEFHRGTVRDLVSRLETICTAERVQAEPAALSAIARMADGGYRDALTLLEQAIVTSDGIVSVSHVNDQLGIVSDEAIDVLLTAVAEGKTVEILQNLDEAYRLGRDPRAVLESVLLRLGELVRAGYGLDSTHVADSTIRASQTASARLLGMDRMMTLRSELATAHALIREVTIPKIWLEAELIRISSSLKGQRTESVAHVAAATDAKKSRPETVPKPIDRSLESLAKAWQATVSEISKLSKVAAVRLARTRLVAVSETSVQVEFPRQVEADLVRHSQKMLPTVLSAWHRHSGGEFAVEFVVKQKDLSPRPTQVEKTAVESPLEGDSLVEAAREVLGGEGGINS